jgi:hypothetical protein
MRKFGIADCMIVAPNVDDSIMAPIRMSNEFSNVLVGYRGHSYRFNGGIRIPPIKQG